MIKKQVILSCEESKRYKKEGVATYVFDGHTYNVANVDGVAKVISIVVPETTLEDISVIVRE